MDNFQKKFIEEATDLINHLEQALLSLEQRPQDQNLISEIFRVMHSLKGGGAMFGFETISNYTHNLETIYDFVREGKMVITQDLLSITLDSVDHLRNLLNKDNADSAVNERNNDILTKKILQIIEKLENNNFATETENLFIEPENQNIDGERTYYIKFVPNENIFENGTNPLYLIDELYGLGKCKIFSRLNKVPVLADLSLSKCYTYWEIILVSSTDLNSIHDVFIFVEEESELLIEQIAEKNLLNNDNFVSYLISANLEDLDLNTLRGFTEITDKEIFIPVETETVNTKEQLKTVQKDNIISSVRVATDKLDHLMNLVSELVTTQASLSLFVEEHQVMGMTQIVENLESITRQLRDTAFNMSLIPLETILTRFQRLVRDLSTEFNKDIIFKAEGAETELDKTLIQGLTEPLMHIIRNSIDHGIESAEERLQQGKPKQGTILLKAYYSGASVHIRVQDDGRGISPKVVREKAISKNFIQAESVLTEKEILDLIFLPGFSTASSVTDVSGRGVGMDVVKRRIDEIRGEVELRTQVNVGTSIIIKLPLTLSIVDGLLVSIKDTMFIIPLSVVNKIRAVEHSRIIKSFNSIIVIDGEQIPIYYLREEFGIFEGFPELEKVILVNYEEKAIGIVVDNVIGEYQAVLKPLGKLYKKQDIFSGATILGDGTVALVMDTNKIINEFSSKII